MDHVSDVVLVEEVFAPCRFVVPEHQYSHQSFGAGHGRRLLKKNTHFATPPRQTVGSQVAPPRPVVVSCHGDRQGGRRRGVAFDDRSVDLWLCIRLLPSSCINRVLPRPALQLDTSSLWIRWFQVRRQRLHAQAPRSCTCPLLGTLSGSMVSWHSS